MARIKIKMLIFLLLLAMNWGVVYAQEPTQISIPQLKENREIDSIMNIVVKNSRSKNICFSLTSVNSPVGRYFSVLRLPKGENDVYYRATQPEAIKEFGYFMFKGFNVFVYGDDEPTVFFKNTNKRFVFKLVTLKDRITWSDPDSLYAEDPEHNHGHFIFGSSEIRDKILPGKEKN
jgi:hypothetical protein